jgi:multiple sugar transport system ATP-binding protein
VTHDQVEAMTLGDRVVVMRDGRVQQVGDPLELYNQPANLFVAGFIGSPAMNFATVRIASENGALWATSEGIRLKLPEALAQRLGPSSGKEVTLGIRPEDLRIANGADPADMSIEAVVEVIERLGSEILLDVAVGQTTMVASVEPSTRSACISSTTKAKRRSEKPPPVRPRARFNASACLFPGPALSTIGSANSQARPAPNRAGNSGRKP